MIGKMVAGMVAGAALVLASVASPAQAETGGQSWRCQRDTACFYAGIGGRRLLTALDECDFYNFNDMGIGDRMSSAWNRTDADVSLYDWDDDEGYIHIVTLHPGQYWNFPRWADNRVDGVGIDC